jgi:hypothetical protein
MNFARNAIGIVLVLSVFTCRMPAAQDGNVNVKNLRSMRYTSRAKDRAIAWKKDLRAKLADLLKIDDLLSSKTPIPFNPKTVSSEKRAKYVFHEMEINSTKTRRIKIVLTLPTNLKGPQPAVLAIAGHGGNRHKCYESARYGRFAHLLAEKGYVTISTSVSRHKVYEKGRTLMGERLWDLMRCVDFLTSLKEVDSRRIGCAGLSLGGEMTMWLGAMDQRLTATVSAGFLTRMDQMEKNHCMCWKFPGLRQLVDFSDIYSMTAPRALLCQNGLKEPPSQFPVSIARQALKEIGLIYTDFKRPENLGLVAHKGGHEIDAPSLLAFFDKHLGRRKDSGNKMVPLMDGKTLTGWHAVGGGKWTVEDGAFVGRAKKARLYGLLVSDKVYKNFIVSFSFKCLAGDSGFYIRTIMEKPDKAKGLQVQVGLPGSGAGGIYESYGRQWLDKPTAAEEKKILKADGWNQMTISASGGDVVVHVNGTKTAELKNDKGRPKGHFALQMHSGNVMHVMFKDIKIRELP